VKNRKGSAVGEFKGRPFALFKLLEGRHLQNPNNTGYLSCHDEISRAMASLHLLTQN
jgi:Ser/Thr protein kinase RdoA (MazF antagonist)